MLVDSQVLSFPASAGDLQTREPPGQRRPDCGDPHTGPLSWRGPGLAEDSAEMQNRLSSTRSNRPQAARPPGCDCPPEPSAHTSPGSALDTLSSALVPRNRSFSASKNSGNKTSLKGRSSGSHRANLKARAVSCRGCVRSPWNQPGAPCNTRWLQSALLPHQVCSSRSP